MQATDQEKQVLRNAEQLKITMESAGWTTVVKPLMDRLIQDAIGYKSKSGEWVVGEIHKPREHMVNIPSYTLAIMELDIMLNDHFRLAEEIKEKYKDTEKKEVDGPEYSSPMKDTRYFT